MGMSGTVHIFDFVAQSGSVKIPAGVCPLFGGERFLQKLAINEIRQAWGGDDSDFTISQFEGPTVQWADIMDELSSKSLFDSGAAKAVIIDNADPFVKLHRDRLEDLVDKPPADGTLFLVVETWASNTKLYKRIEKGGLQIHCDAPIIKRGRGKQRDDAKIIKWLISQGKSKYDFKLPETGASVLIELTECNFGRMDQELNKISLYANEAEELTPMAIRKIVGGWPTQTMWSAIDSALDGKAGHALDLLAQLFAAGEHPLAMFGQISWSLRRFAEAGELVTRDSRRKRRINMNDSLKAAGFKTWGNELQTAGGRLKQLGRKRVGELLDQLVEVDFALKRTHSREERGRLMLELLFTRMSEQLQPN